jgi:hypothetical protein
MTEFSEARFKLHYSPPRSRGARSRRFSIAAREGIGCACSHDARIAKLVGETDEVTEQVRELRTSLLRDPAALDALGERKDLRAVHLGHPGRVRHERIPRSQDSRRLPKHRPRRFRSLVRSHLYGTDTLCLTRSRRSATIFETFFAI